MGLRRLRPFSLLTGADQAFDHSAWKFRAAEVRWCVFDHRTGKVLTGEELRAAAQAVNL